jgi:hypothetical protein
MIVPDRPTAQREFTDTASIALMPLVVIRPIPVMENAILVAEVYTDELAIS